MSEVGPASVVCRYTGVGCHYKSSGSEEFVESNYRQHLRESHRIADPRVEREELKVASVLETVDEALAAGYAAARYAAAARPPEEGDTFSIRRSDTGNVARARLLRADMELGPERAQALMRGPHAAFDYGYAGEGPRTLALALLLEALGNPDHALAAHAAFAEEFFNTKSATFNEITFTRRHIAQWFKLFSARGA